MDFLSTIIEWFALPVIVIVVGVMIIKMVKDKFKGGGEDEY